MSSHLLEEKSQVGMATGRGWVGTVISENLSPNLTFNKDFLFFMPKILF